MLILLDTNIILDIALKRMPFYSDSASVFKKIDSQSITAFITATTITDIYYIAKKEKGHSIAITFITDLLQYIDLIGIDKKIIIEALSSAIIDFEDAIQSISSSYFGIDYITTRNTKDYQNSSVKAISPNDFLKLL